MTELLSDSLASQDSPSDAELISRVRGGDLAAYGELFERHVGAARRLARQLVRGPDSEDLVSDAFTKVMAVLQNGGGPDVAFRAYLLTAVRRLHVDKMRAQSRLTTTDDMTPFDPGVPFQDTAVAGFESGAAAKAFATLPERWQLVLWHLEVEGQKPVDIAPLLGMTPNSVSALAYRAREGLRQAFLTAHLADTATDECRWTTEHLGGYARAGLSKRDAGKVKDHLDDCRACTAMYLEVTEVNSNLRAIIGPLLLGAAATGYLAASAGGGITAAGGLLILLDRAKDVVVANLTTVAAGSAAAAVSTVAVVAVATGAGPLGGDEPRADGPSTTAPSTAPQEPGKRERRQPRDRPSPREAAQVATVSDLMLSSAAVSGDAVILDVTGLPDQPAVVVVDLVSASGRTTFTSQSGACTVTDAEPTRARCTTTSGSGGNNMLELAPTSFQAVLPLAFPEDLTSDRLTVAVGLEGQDDANGADNSASFDFAPTLQPVDPPAAVEADLRLALEPAGTDAVRATVTGLPAEPSEILLDLAGGLSFTAAPDGCAQPAPGMLRCGAPPGSFEATLPISYDADLAPVDVSITVTGVDLQETAPEDNTVTVMLGEAPLPLADLVVTAPGNSTLLGTGKFEVRVAGVPGVPFRLSVTTDDPEVVLEGIPGAGTRPVDGDTCTYVDGSTTMLECTTADSTFEGVLDLDLRRLAKSDSVDITLAAAVPGFEDSNPEDNLAQLRMSHRAIVVLEVRLTLANLDLLLTLGLYLGSIALPLG